jgi:hypothetical protein
VTLSAAIIDALLQSGATREQIAAAIKADIAERAGVEEARLEARRKANRERQQKKRAGHALSRSVTHVTRDAPPNESILTPPVITPKPDGLAPTQKSKSVRGSRLPDDWQLPAEWAAWARERRGWSEAEIAEESEIFANYWQAKSGAGACHVNWAKTWKNWVIRSHRADGFKVAPKAAGPLTIEQLHSSIRFRRDIGDDAKAEEYERELAQRLAA